MRVGKDIIDADTREEMSKRTDWGSLLKSDEIKLHKPTENAKERGKWRRPDW